MNRSILVWLAAIVAWWVGSNAALAADRTISSEYVSPDGKKSLVIDAGEASYGLSASELRNLRAKGVVIRDVYSFGTTKDCSRDHVRCIDIGSGTMVLAVDIEAFAAGKPYSTRGFEFVPVCVGVAPPPSCAAGVVRFRKRAKKGIQGFFLFSGPDGILAIGLHLYPESEVEQMLALRTGTAPLLAQRPPP